MSEASELHMDRGLELYEDDKFVEAIAEWREAILYDPEDACLYNNIGLALSELGQQEAAIAEWRKAVRLKRGYKSPHRSLAYALSATGYSPEALAEVRTAVRLYPDEAGLHVWLGYHLTVEANKSDDRAGYEPAAVAFQQAINLDPSISDAHRSLGLIQWRLGKKREAIKTLKAAITADPNDVEAHIALAARQSRMGYWRGAFQTVLAISDLTESEERSRYYGWMNRLMLRVQLAFLTATGLAALLIWLRWKRQK